MGCLDERTKQDFLVYANSVIKSRAIPKVEDNLKPIHRRILWSMYESKYLPNKPTVKSAKVVGNVMGSYHPHGDSSIYEALVRLSQWWKLRYPLVTMQGNNGNIFGDKSAASRYTEAKLSEIGLLMVENTNKESVEFKPNFDASTEEPITLPSRFPWLLCGNNSGIAVGMSSDLVSHNFTEVANGIKYYIDHQDCSIADLMQYIKGPDFPTGGKIINGEDLLNIYTTGRGAVKIMSHYDISKKGNKTVLIFHDLPYGVDIDNGIKAPLKKLVIDDGYEVFEDINIEKVGNRQFDIKITLSKDADVAKCLEILFNKTRLCDSIKINNTVIINGEPQLLNLKEIIQYWVNYRSNIISKLAHNDYNKTNHKLTVTIGLQKCMSDIDKLISLIRNASNSAAAKSAIMAAFELTDEQATAVLDMKLSKLSRLDISELNDTERELEETLAKLKNIIDNESVRLNMIKDDLDEIKKIVGNDERLTEIYYCEPNAAAHDTAIKEEYLIYADGLHLNNEIIDTNLVDAVFAYSPQQIMGFTANGEMRSVNTLGESFIGAFVKQENSKVVTVTANGNVKVSLSDEYKFTKSSERLLKLKEGDQLVFAACATDNQYLVLLDAQNHIIKLPIKDFSTTGKNTSGVKSGFEQVIAAAIVDDSDNLLFVTKDNKGKLTPVKDFNIDHRGNKGQLVAENTIAMRNFNSERETIYCVPKQGKVIAVPRNKVSIKSRTAIGASISNRALIKII